MATASRTLDGLSPMPPRPAFCAAKDMARGEGEAENRAESGWAGDCVKDAGDTMLRGGKPVGLAVGEIMLAKAPPGDRVVPKPKLLRGEGDGRLANELCDIGDGAEVMAKPLPRGLGDASDIFPN